ncbi:MAG: carbohydrate ABC transporter permease [Anaerolineae bacterium]|nr:carbohydrate ABC transporter permease [Candidatus Roseilinea sp.]MDW8448694.1 carbohydrate ABC transporter permease [Anaerolineae bacterium]
MRRVPRNIGLTVLWIGVTILTLFPIYWLFVISARSRVELFEPQRLIQTTFFAENYIRPLSDRTFRGYIINSVIIATGNALLVTILAVAATYALSRYRLKGSSNIFFWTITNRMAPPAAFLLPLFLLYARVLKIGDWKMFDTHIGLILLYCVFNLPFAIWLLKSIMDGIPIELDEAARVDGATTRMVLFRIIIPLAAPGIAITAILSWVFAWNEYLFAATLTSVTARTITTGLAEFVTVTGTNWGEMAAVSVIALLPALLFLALVQKYIVIGLTFGAVK